MHEFMEKGTELEYELLWCPRNSSHISDVIPAERVGARESRNPGRLNASGCPLQPEADPSEALWRIRAHDGGEATDFFCELLRQNTKRIGSY
jgi:hypothetical protein